MAIKSSAILQRLKGSPSSIRKVATPGERVLGALFPNRGIGWPGSLTSAQIPEMVTHYRDWVYVAINVIAQQTAGLTPNLAYVVDGHIPGKTTKACFRHDPEVYQSFGASMFRESGPHSFLTMGAYRSKALSVVKPHEELEPLEIDHPLRRLLENPNPFDTSFDILFETVLFLELTGVAYLWCVPNSVTRRFSSGYPIPAELWVLPSHWVWPRAGGGPLRQTQYMGSDWNGFRNAGHRYVDPNSAGFGEELIHYYEVRPWGGMGSAGILRIPPDEIVMLRTKNPLDKIMGYSRLSAAAQWIDLEESITRSRFSQAMNVARPEFWVELGPGYEDPDDDRIRRVEAKIAQRSQGEWNYGKPVITPPGAKITPLSFNPTEMAYFQCCCADTECLTRDGWKRYDELTTSSEIACYDPDKGELVYTEPSGVHVYDYDGEMHRWIGPHVDQLVTPNHRCFVGEGKYTYSGRTSKDCSWKILRADEMGSETIYRLKVAAPVVSVEPTEITLDNYGGWRQREKRESHVIAPEVWLRFLGHYISEGCVYARKRGNGVNEWGIDICQSPDATSRSPLTFAAIKDSVEAMPYKWRTWKSDSGCIHWSVSDKGLYERLLLDCGKSSKEKRIPAYVKEWSAPYLKILLDALIEGDGSIKSKSSTEWSAQYWTSSRDLADDVMEVAIKCGYRAQIAFRPDKREKFSGVVRYVVNISTKNDQRLLPSMRVKEHYKGKVWCVTVPTGLFVVRRKSEAGYKAVITANSEEQVRDMILSTFNVPKAAVGISNDMTYGSILACMAQMAQSCLNPRLTMIGQTLTKHLADRWSTPRRRVKLWFDDCVPVDPAQLNNDLQTDHQLNSVMPNEVRALRGRKSFHLGGDNPMVAGPGGLMPLPLNSTKGVLELAEVIGRYATLVQPQPPGQPAAPAAPMGGPGMAGMAPPDASGLSPTDGTGGGLPPEEIEPFDQETDLDWDPDIKEPNRFPSLKSISKSAHRPVADRLAERLEEVLRRVDTGPDYQELYWHPETRQAWWVTWDGDEVSDVKEILQALEGVRGVRSVRGEAEYAPPEGQGWYMLHPERREHSSRRTEPLSEIPEPAPEQEPKHSHSCLLLFLSQGRSRGGRSAEAGYRLLQRDVENDDLIGDGKVTEPHVTVLYGFSFDDLTEVAEIVRGSGPVDLTFGVVTTFPPTESSDQAEVLKVDINSPSLDRLHRMLASRIPHVSAHGGYSPHLTVAYVKPGRGVLYEGASDMAGLEATFSVAVFEDRFGVRTEIPLVTEFPVTGSRMTEFPVTAPVIVEVPSGA